MKLSQSKKSQFLQLPRNKINFPIIQNPTNPSTQKKSKKQQIPPPQQNSLLKKLTRIKSIMISHKINKFKNIHHQNHLHKNKLSQIQQQSYNFNKLQNKKSIKTLNNCQELSPVTFPPVYSVLQIGLKNKYIKNSHNYSMAIEQMINRPVGIVTYQMKQKQKSKPNQSKNYFKSTNEKQLQTNSSPAQQNYHKHWKNIQSLLTNKKKCHRYQPNIASQPKIKFNTNINDHQQFNRWEYQHHDQDHHINYLQHISNF